MAAAIELLEEGGLEGIELPEVARRAGVNPTTVYRRWGSSERLIGEVLMERGRPLSPTPDTGSLRGDLGRLLAEGGELMRMPQVRAVFEVLLRAGSTPSVEAAEARDRFWAAHLDEMRAVVERAATRGEVPPGTDAAGLADLVIGPVLVRLFMGLELTPAASEAIVDRALAALACPRRDGESPHRV